MKDLLLIILVLLVLSAIAGIERWRYDECRRVGHSTAYCIIRMTKPL